MIASPVGTGDLHQLEDLELAGGWHVRATAEIDEIALAVEGDFLTLRNGADDLRLVLLAHGQKQRNRLVAIPDFPHHRFISRSKFPHLGFDGFQIFRGEWP